MHSFADLIGIEVPSTELRDMSRVKCKYFGTCAGCQYQVRFSLTSEWCLAAFTMGR